ncbi:MAG TPA: hypothetical protein VKB34_09235, partial [Povalibacter sp.]|nr:hypothetical protein [Povalibacter sp.]
RVLFGFWRGQRVDPAAKYLKPGGKYEMATLELREGMDLGATTARRMTREAVALNHSLGNPTRVAGAKKSAKKSASKSASKSAKKASKGRAKRKRS